MNGRHDLLNRAVAILRRGGLVAFPTETVYGLGADARNPAAVSRIFAAKGRPSTNPVIVHVADATAARLAAGDWPTSAQRLALRFWPGPLTIVLPRGNAITQQVSAFSETVGLRVPNHPLALEFLDAFAGPIAAPSANRSNRISPTTAGHVQEELGDAIDLILDGGPCTIGIESTVLDLTQSTPAILRPGAISRAQLEHALDTQVVDQPQSPTDGAPLRSPGQLATHYAPKACAFRFNLASVDAGRNWLDRNNSAAVQLLLIRDSPIAAAISKTPRPAHTIRLLPSSPPAYAQELYRALRDADRASPTAILVELPPDEPAWRAINDRLLRATTPLAVTGP